MPRTRKNRKFTWFLRGNETDDEEKEQNEESPLLKKGRSLEVRQDQPQVQALSASDRVEMAGKRLALPSSPPLS